MTPAFSTSIALISRTTIPTTTTKHRPMTTSMQLQTEKRTKPTSFPKLDENKRVKTESEYRGPQGFTPYAEKVNGRIAMLGFVIGLVTEIFSGVPINEQVLIMFSPLTNLVTSIVNIAH